jgi:hypothetical protein
VSLVLRRAAVAAVMVLGGFAPVLTAAGSATASTPTLPNDPDTAGALTICDNSGQQVTSGSINQRPAFHRVIDVTSAPSAYRVRGVATLYGAQPRPDVVPAEWSTEQLSGGGLYSDPDHPMAVGTSGDESIATYLGDYPLSDLGVFQLRLILVGPDAPAYNTYYDASYIQVNGDTWTQLNPGPDDCATSGTSVSVERMLLPASEFHHTKAANPPPTPGSATSDGQSPAPTSGGHSSQPSGTPATSIGGTSPAAASAQESSGSDSGRNIALVVAALLLAAFVGTFFVRARRTK